MARGRRWFVLGRVNPVAPSTVALAGFVVFALGYRAVGAGLAIGSGLALINSLLLSQRVDLAAAVDDVGRAILVMQLGLLVTFTIIAVVVAILVHISIPLAVGAAAGFAAAQLSMLALFYVLQARHISGPEGEPT